MNEEYRLGYSGEVLDGQHTAVVKKRLAAVLKLDDERMTVLFSGKSVVVKKATDEKTRHGIRPRFKKLGLDYGYCLSMMEYQRRHSLTPLKPPPTRAAPTSRPLQVYKLCQKAHWSLLRMNA
jgi:hypothetical protein